MIRRLLRGLPILVMYLCLATIITEVILLAGFLSGGKMNRDKMVKILAIVHDVDLDPKDETDELLDDPSTQQASLQEIRETRAKQYKLLNRREDALRHDLDQLAFQERKLTEQLDHYKRVRTAFEKELAEREQGAVATGREEEITYLLAIKPDQAKAVLSNRLKENEIDEVVSLIQGMPASKAKKILAEFHPTENEQVTEMLTKIGQGFPDADLAQQTQSDLQQGPN